MVISHRKRFVLLLPWKAASQTISLRLSPYDESPYGSFFYFNAHLNRVVHRHLTCAEFACLPESQLGYLMAAFVRNPYDRVYAGFWQLQVDLRDLPHATYSEPWIRLHVVEQLRENFAQLLRAEFDFDRWVERLSEEQIYEIGRNTSFPLHPAHYWTHVGGRQVVDHIGRVEDFEADFQEFLGRVAVDQVQSITANVVEREGGAASNPFGYRYVDRMDARSIAKINRLFERDFELFGYERPAAPQVRRSRAVYSGTF